MALGKENLAQREALVGRLPVMREERVYKGFWSFLWTCTSFEVATWGFVIGSALPFVGNTWIALLTFTAGAIIGLGVATMATGIPGVRYGTDAVEYSKSCFGSRGSYVVLIMLLIAMVGWVYILEAISSRMLGGMLQSIVGAASMNETVVIIAAISLLLLTWLIAIYGPKFFMYLSNFLAPGILIVTSIVLIMLFVKYGTKPFTANIDQSYAMATGTWMRGLLGMEFGIAIGWAFVPMAGGMTRLVAHGRNAVGPVIVGMAVLGLGYVCSVSAFAAVKFDTADPIIWFQELGGHIAGPIFLGFIVLHNIAPMIVMIYISGVAMQQIPALTRVKWHWLILGMLLPGVLVAFRTEWVLAHVMNIVTYNGVFFVGMAGICLVDYYWLRRTELDIRSLYCRTKAGKYYFWGGFNWLALAIVAGSSYLAIVMLNPVTYAAGPGFRFIGSSIPTLVVSGLVYYALTRLVVIPLGKGGYSRYESEVVRAAEPQLADSEVSL